MRKGLLIRIFGLVSLSQNLKRIVMRMWYQNMGRFDKDSQITFMNYGYANSNAGKIKLKSADEKDRYCIQLYNHVAGSLDVKGLEVLEVGCGRGGGSSYIARYLKPKSVNGVDFSKMAIDFCKRNYSTKGLSFSFEDAESFTIQNEKFDVVVNIESSHCYRNMKLFLHEVFRVLKPNGYFLFADFRGKGDINSLNSYLQNSGLKLLMKKKITKNVLKALDLDSNRKVELIKKKVPKMLHKTFLQFAGVKGTEIYESFRTGEREYFSFVLQKIK